MIQPLGTKVLIRPDVQAEKKTGAGIIVIEAQSPYSSGRVIEVSKDIESKLSKGDCVLYDTGAGMQIEDDNMKLLLVDEKNVIAKVAQSNSVSHSKTITMNNL